MILGSHVSQQGGLDKAVGRAVEAGCDCLQIFASPPRRWPVEKITPKNADQVVPVAGHAKSDDPWAAKPLAADSVEAWKTSLAESGLSHPIAHGSYLINMGTPDDVLFQKSVDALVVEMERGNQLNLDGLVVHPGAYTKSCEEDGIRRIVDGIGEVLQRVPAGSCRLLLENTAGQGTCLGHTIEQLSQMMDGVGNDSRVGVCLDTCHAYAAGYEINVKSGFADFRQRLDDCLPKNSVAALHLNDSKKPLGSRVDRHEHIGQGEIGLDAFRFVFADSMLGKLPGYLETEKGTDEKTGEDWDVLNLRVLRDL